MNKKFYNFARDETGKRELYIDGEIANNQWFGDECTPAKFRAELFADKGDITLWISSPGGDCFAASQIYTMLMDYSGSVTVKIYGMCASAASVIAMVGTKVMMSPTSMMLIHNPWTVAVGEKKDMVKAGEMLDEVKECIINSYEIRDKKNLTGYRSNVDFGTVVTRIMPQGFDCLLLPEKYVDSPLIGNYLTPRIRVFNYDVKAAVGQYEKDEDAVPLPQRESRTESHSLARQKRRVGQCRFHFERWGMVTNRYGHRGRHKYHSRVGVDRATA